MSNVANDPHALQIDPLAPLNPMSVVYMNDRFTDGTEAQVPINVHALHYGTGAFEGIRVYGDGSRAWMFRARDHYERLTRNAKLLHMSPGVTIDGLIELTIELLRRNDALQDAYIRPLVFNGSQKIGANLTDDGQLSIMAIASARQPAPRAPVSTMISRWRRFPSASCPAGAKITGLYINSSFARADAVAAGYDQPILLTIKGEVSEGFGANLFAVFGRRIVTPPTTADILNGITRQTILEYLRSNSDCEVAEERIEPEQLSNADELFFCGTGMEVTPIGRCLETVYGDGDAGPVTRRVATWYRSVVTRQIETNPAWFTPIHDE